MFLFWLCGVGIKRVWWPSWSYGSWIYNYICNKCISPLTLWVRIPLRRDELDTTLCDKVCQWLATGRWFSLDPPVSSTNKTDRHDMTEILLKVALNTITLPLPLIELGNIFKIFRKIVKCFVETIAYKIVVSIVYFILYKLWVWIPLMTRCTRYHIVW